MPKIKPQQTVHIKSKNKTGMVIAVNGNKLTVMTINGNITADVNDVEVVKAHEGKESMKLKDIAQPKKKITEGFFTPGYIDDTFDQLLDDLQNVLSSIKNNANKYDRTIDKMVDTTISDLERARKIFKLLDRKGNK